MASTKCVLVCPGGTHDPIELPHLQPVFIGRSPATKVTDTQVSRNHVELTANCTSRQVHVCQLGLKPSVANGKSLAKGEVSSLADGESLFLLADKYENVVEFVESVSTGQQASKKLSETDGLRTAMAVGKRKLDANVSLEGTPAMKRLKETSVVTQSNSNRPTMADNEESSDSEQLQKVKEHLELMKKSLEGLPSKSNATSEKKVENTESSVVAPAVMAASVPLLASNWMQKDTLLVFTSKGVRATCKIAGFDLDGTIIGTQSGKVFPTHSGDWKILLADVPGRLRQLFADGYKIVFMSNQMGIEKKKLKVEDFKSKVENIVTKLNIPIQVLVSTGSGRYRKPGLGMWNYLISEGNAGITVSKQDSFFVGDAAGRPKDWAAGKKKDFSCGDRLFAINAGLEFFTPEEFFLKQSKAKFTLPSFDPRSLATNTPLLMPENSVLTLGTQEVIVMVGSPAAGKSQFVQTHLVPKGYIHVNRDTMGTWQKCVQATKDALAKGKSVIVDNTNPDVESRSRYIQVAKSARVTCRCFVMSTSLEHARHNERFREMTDKKHEPISEMVFNSYKSKYKEPSVGEGFTELVKVNFVPCFAGMKHHEALYRQFLLEK